MSIARRSTQFLVAAAAGLLLANLANAATFSVASSPGNIAPPNFANGANVMAQLFSPSVTTAPEDPSGFTATPSPQPAQNAQVFLNSFTFTKSGTFNAPQAAGNANTFLVIEDSGSQTNGFTNFTGLTTATVTGVSTNSVDTTNTVATGTALTWNFNSLPVTYGDYLTAGMATISGTTITFIPADIQLVRFSQDPNNSAFFPDANYGGGPSITNESAAGNFNAAAAYTFGSGFFGTGSNAEDTTFTANFSTTPTPEPVSLGMLSLAGMALAGRRRK
jgi:hypothetical protein